jgi:hypothetical protein
MQIAVLIGIAIGIAIVVAIGNRNLKVDSDS